MRTSSFVLLGLTLFFFACDENNNTPADPLDEIEDDEEEYKTNNVRIGENTITLEMSEHQHIVYPAQPVIITDVFSIASMGSMESMYSEQYKQKEGRKSTVTQQTEGRTLNEATIDVIIDVIPEGRAVDHDEEDIFVDQNKTNTNTAGAV